MNITCIRMPNKKGDYQPFKIRSMEDVKIFVEEAMKNGTYYYTVSDDELYVVKKKDDEVSVSVKYGDLENPFNPLVEIANNQSKAYSQDIYGALWKIRKSINEKWFNDED